MRVLHVSHTSVVSGAEHSLLTLIATLPREAVIGIACPDGDLSARARGLGLEVFPIPELEASLGLRLEEVPGALWRLLVSVARVQAVARRRRASVVHGNSLRASLICVGARCVGGPPVVAHVRDVLPPGLVPRQLNRIVRLGGSQVVALSGYVAGRFTTSNQRGAPITIVDNPVDLRRFRAPAAASLTSTAQRRVALGIVGQISSWKGHDTAVRALAALAPRHAGAELWIVGAIKFATPATRLDNPAFLQDVVTLVAQLGLHSRVHFLGERSDVPEVMAALDVLLVPSVEEPFGRTVVEAMAAGTPVVATSIGGPAEIIQDGITGTLVPPGQPELWARAIDRLLDDRERAATMAARASAVADHRFTAERHAARMLEIFATASDATTPSST